MFSDYNEHSWIFGPIFVKKFYPIIFNQNSKTIGFYFKEQQIIP